jgi:ABC-type thiamine transport system ATPase subunit
MGVSYVPQVRNIFAALTIEENLEMGLYLKPEDVEGALRLRDRAVPAAQGPTAKQRPGRCPAGSARWSPWRGR